VIAVDTSVWVSALRGGTDSTALTLQALLEADEVVLPLPVRLELMAGVARAHRPALKRALTGLPVVFPTDQTWRVVEQWLEPAADAGFRFGQTDLLIAALASDVDALVWSLDKDFQHLASLQLVRLYYG
jgi:predicted nucleic acid-binding protein